MNPITLGYHFQLPDGSKETFKLQLDPQTLQIIQSGPQVLAGWTALENARCINCCLESHTVSHCPAAVCIAGWLKRFVRLLSTGAALVKVKTPERLVNGRTTIKAGLASLMGLLLIVSGCPRTALMKPLARYHLPFCGFSESVWQTVAAYLMVQYFRQRDGLAADIALSGLLRLYAELQSVRQGFAARLRSACSDAQLSNLFTQCLPDSIDPFFEEIRRLFGPYLHSRQSIQSSRSG